MWWRGATTVAAPLYCRCSDPGLTCWCVCAGVPNTGKSEFIDSIVLSLALNHYWPICFASFEKRPAFHFRDLAEKIWGKPFNQRDGISGPTMTQREVHPDSACM